MAISYRKLWKLLIDKDMKKKDLRIQSGISTNALAKLGKNERVTTDVLEKVCLTLISGAQKIFVILKLSCFIVCRRSKKTFILY